MESVLEDSISFQLLKQSAISGSAWTSMEYGLYCRSVSVSSKGTHTLRKQLPTRSVDVPVSCILAYTSYTLHQQHRDHATL